MLVHSSTSTQVLPSRFSWKPGWHLHWMRQAHKRGQHLKDKHYKSSIALLELYWSLPSSRPRLCVKKDWYFMHVLTYESNSFHDHACNSKSTSQIILAQWNEWKRHHPQFQKWPSTVSDRDNILELNTIQSGSGTSSNLVGVSASNYGRIKNETVCAAWSDNGHCAAPFGVCALANEGQYNGCRCTTHWFQVA